MRCVGSLLFAHVARSKVIVLRMPSSSIARMCGCIGTTLNCPFASLSSFLYVAFTITFAKRVAAVERGGLLANILSPGVNVDVTGTNMS